MAQAHAQSGGALSVLPFGATLRRQRTHVLEHASLMLTRRLECAR